MSSTTTTPCPQTPDTALDDFLDSLLAIDETINRSQGVESLMTDVIDMVRKTFDADQAWLMFPCDPDARFWRVPYRSTKDAYPIGFPPDTELTVTPRLVANNRLVLEADGPVALGPGEDLDVPEEARAVGARSALLVALHPGTGKPWLMGLHHCSAPRVWTAQERKLYAYIRGRITTALSNTLLHNHLRELSSRLFTSGQDERRRVASHIHDELGQPLLAMKVALDNALYDADQNAAATSIRPALESSSHTVASLVERIRLLQDALYPTTLSDLGLAVSLAGFAEAFGELHPGLTVQHDIAINETDVPDALPPAVLRIAQDVLFAAAKNGPGQLSLDLHRSDDALFLHIRCNRRNALGEHAPGSVSELVELTGGTLSYIPHPAETTLTCHWPLT